MEDEEFRSVINKVIGAVVEHPDVKKLAGSGKVYAFGAEETDIAWGIDATGEPRYFEGTSEKFDVRATMTKDDWLQTLQGKLSPTQAMLRRKIHVEGSVMAISSLSMDALVQTYKEQMEGQSA